MGKITFYWRDGKREILEGASPDDALNKAGYGAGALRALDFRCDCECNDYEWFEGSWVATAEYRTRRGF